MPLFICEKCKTIENTALGKYWGYQEKLCSLCGWGKWHNHFKKEKFSEKKYKFKHKIIDGFVVNN